MKKSHEVKRSLFLSSLQAQASSDAQARIQALSDEVARLAAIINNDGSNSGTPTSKTPLNKNKVIPNSREKTGRKKRENKSH